MLPLVRRAIAPVTEHFCYARTAWNLPWDDLSWMKGVTMSYFVSANLYSQDLNDYVAHWDGGTFDDLEAARKFWDSWCPDADAVAEACRRDYVEKSDASPSGNYELEVGLWDEQGYDVEFWNRTVAWQAHLQRRAHRRLP